MLGSAATRWLAAAALVGSLAVPGIAAAGTTLPVPYEGDGLAAAVAAELGHPGSPPPGANDWTCTPTAQHPEPVVLVHGASANMTENWQTIAPLLANNGYCVYALTYGVPAGTPFPADQVGGRTVMEQSSHELSAFVDRVLAATGAAKVDIVGHSEGSLMPAYYIKFLGGAAKVDHFVGLTPLFKGSNLLYLDDLNILLSVTPLGPAIDALVGAVFPSALEFLSHSAVRANLGQGSPAVPGVIYTEILTTHDEAVVPYTNGLLNAPNATNIVIQDRCPFDFAGHAMMAFDPNVTQVMLNALDPAHARQVHCSFVPVSP